MAAASPQGASGPGVSDARIENLSVSYACAARSPGFACVQGSGPAAKMWPGRCCNAGHPMIAVASTDRWAA